MKSIRLLGSSALIVTSLSLLTSADSHLTARPASDLILTKATVVVSASADPIERKSAEMLVAEVERRSGFRWAIQTQLPETRDPAILLGSRERIPPGADAASFTFPVGPGGTAVADGYVLKTTSERRRVRVYAIGSDSRGTMFAAGRLLRHLRVDADKLRIPPTDISTAPFRPLRGHQLGWRPKSNTYDRWGLKEYEQYVRDLIVWGTNAIELIPLDPDGDFEASTEFNARLAEMIASYGLEVWLWYPFDDRIPAAVRGSKQKPGDTACPSESDERAFVLKRRTEVFKRFKRLDSVFIPGGDPGGCNCEKCRPWTKTLLPFAEETASILRAAHPNAQLWLSNQGFKGPENEEFYSFLSGKPPWLTGIVYAPWAEESLESMRKRAPASIPIRAYPDITHTVRCQYPARDWDNALALIYDREPPIYRPTESVAIARFEAQHTIGAITYSDGVNDDFNKAVWSAVLWDPTTSPEQIAEDYGRIHFGAWLAAGIGRDILQLERNWNEPLLQNRALDATYELWSSLDQVGEDSREPKEYGWRLLMMGLRVYYDAYVQRRLRLDADQETRALALLRSGYSRDPGAAIRHALREAESGREPISPPRIRQRLLEIGEMLHKSIGMQLSVTRWGASGDERGAILDHLDRPLANQAWMTSELKRVAAIPDLPRQREEIERIIHWEDPGPGGFYDDLGNPAKQPRLVRPLPWEKDPGYLVNPRTDFRFPIPGGRQSWNNYAEALYDSPIMMRYTGLSRSARYRLRAVYGGRYNPTLKLSADGIEVHGPVSTAGPPTVREWDIPPDSTSDGSLTLRWDRVEGRGAQVCEVWLLRTAN